MNNNSTKCIICEEKDAEFCIKGMTKYCYCKVCAIDHFSDLNLLQKIKKD